MPNQYENQDNVRAHYETTGPEIWDQTEGKVTHFFAGYGTCGTITGVARFLKEKNPAVRDRRHPAGEGTPSAGTEELPGEPAAVDPRRPRSSTTPSRSPTSRRTPPPSVWPVRSASSWGPPVGRSSGPRCRRSSGSDAVAVCISPDNALKYASFYADFIARDGVPEAGVMNDAELPRTESRRNDAPAEGRALLRPSAPGGRSPLGRSVEGCPPMRPIASARDISI